MALENLVTENLARMGVRRGLASVEVPAVWGLEMFAGCVTELSGGPTTAALTLAFRLVVDVQKRGEPVAWVTEPMSTFFPPDAADTGVDLEALAVLIVPRNPVPTRARNPTSRGDLAPRVADHLVRSGGFGLVVLDVGRNVRMPIPIQARLAGLAKKHHTALVILTEEAPRVGAGRSPKFASRKSASLGPLVSLRVEVQRVRRRCVGEPMWEQRLGGQFACEARIVKDKRPSSRVQWRHEESFRGPTGLC